MIKQDLIDDKLIAYRNGGEGMSLWCEENIRVPVYPEGADMPQWVYMGELPKKKHSITLKSYYDMWQVQKAEICRALEMDSEKRFIHRLIIFIEQRGEGKSLKAVLIQLWKFFCFPRQKIMLAANSKDQITFSHYDIMRDLIKNSPELHAIVGKRNIKEKEIVIKDSKKSIISIIRCISSFSGIYSNITGFTFSEMFDLRNETFFSQIYGSTRNMPNALGVVDSTVSRKDHILHRLYKSYVNKKDPKLFVSYRYSKEGHHSDYLNPNMTPEQIASYKATFPRQDFNRYILNLWTAGSNKYFEPEQVEATRIIGLDRQVGRHTEVIELLKKKNKMIETENKLIDNFGNTATLPYSSADALGAIDERLWSIDSIMPLRTKHGESIFANLVDFEELSRLYDSNWVILAGVDRADPESQRSNARTIEVVIAKGAIGSRSMTYTASTALQFIYIVVYVAHIEDHSLDGIKEQTLIAQHEMKGIDKMTAERWGMWDLVSWCEENDIAYEVVYPNPERQKAAFGELYHLYNTGRIKIPTLAVYGSRGEDILEEETLMFEYNIAYKDSFASKKKSLFGSPEKFKRHGVQDDALYALAWAIYGGRELGFDDLREIKGEQWFGDIYQPEGMIGDW